MCTCEPNQGHLSCLYPFILFPGGLGSFVRVDLVLVGLRRLVFPLHPRGIPKYRATDDSDRRGGVGGCSVIRDKPGEGGCQAQITRTITV